MGIGKGEHGMGLSWLGEFLRERMEFIYVAEGGRMGAQLEICVLSVYQAPNNPKNTFLGEHKAS